MAKRKRKKTVRALLENENVDIPVEEILENEAYKGVWIEDSESVPYKGWDDFWEAQKANAIRVYDGDVEAARRKLERDWRDRPKNRASYVPPMISEDLWGRVQARSQEESAEKDSLPDDFDVAYQLALGESDSVRFTKEWEYERSRNWIEVAPPTSRVFRINDKIVTELLGSLRDNPESFPLEEVISYDYSHVPFPLVFVGWGGPNVMEIRDSITGVYWRCETHGFVFDADEEETYLCSKITRRTIGGALLEWERSFALLNHGPWGLIAEHALKCVSTHEYIAHALSKRRIKSLRKASGVKNVPQKYYEVLQQPLRRRREPPEGTHASPSFQHDVRGHWAHRVKRIHGTLKDHERFRWEVRSNDRHQYRFVCGNKITEDDRKYLASIGEPPPSKGWYLRITRYWVRGHKRGPEDTYVPSVHVMGPNLATHPNR